MDPPSYFDELQERIRTHPGKPVFDALQAYDMSKFIFDGNADQLRQLICLLEDPNASIHIDGPEHRQRLQWLFYDVNRQLHNFLTSIMTLVDHTRNLMKENFIKAEHLRDYQVTVKDIFEADPLSKFLQDLRNYITHYAVPQIHLLQCFGPGTRDRKLCLDLNHLEAGFNWSASSQKFIEANKPEFRMLSLVDDYLQKLSAFYTALMDTFQKHMGAELAGVRALMQESNDLWTKMITEMSLSIAKGEQK